MIASEPPADHLQADRWPSAGLEQLGLQPSARARFNDAYGYQVLVKAEYDPGALPEAGRYPGKAPPILKLGAS